MAMAFFHASKIIMMLMTGIIIASFLIHQSSAHAADLIIFRDSSISRSPLNASLDAALDASRHDTPGGSPESANDAPVRTLLDVPYASRRFSQDSLHKKFDDAPVRTAYEKLKRPVYDAQSRIICDVHEYGASGNGDFFDTVAIQAALDACGEHGGIVRFSAGRFLTATVFLRSNLRIEIEEGATILGSADERDYPLERERWYVMVAENVMNVEVTGGGILDGQAHKFVTEFKERKNVMVSWNTSGECYGDECRPRLIGFVNCTNVHVWNVFLHEPAYWCLNIVNCDNVLVENVTIDGDFNIPNNDGIDIEASNNTVIRDCRIDTGDDAICPKTKGGPLFNLTVSDCWIRTKSSGVKLGSASNYDFHGLRFERLKIVESHRGLGLQLRDAGNMSNVIFANIEISTRYYDPSWWGRAEPIYVTACPRNSSTVVGSITNIHFVNITAKSENGIFLTGFHPNVLTNIIFNNVTARFYDAEDPPEITFHDYRPGCQGLVAHSSSGLFIEHAANISLTKVNFMWAPNVSWNVPMDFTPGTVGNLKLLDFSSTTQVPDVGFQLLSRTDSYNLSSSS